MSTSARFTGTAATENTGNKISKDYQTPAYAASIAITTKDTASDTLVKVAQLTGALTLTAGVGTSTTPPMVGDRMTILLGTDGTQRIVTLSTGFISSGTVTIPASKFACVEAVFNGTAWQVVSREITA